MQATDNTYSTCAFQKLMEPKAWTCEHMWCRQAQTDDRKRRDWTLMPLTWGIIACKSAYVQAWSDLLWQSGVAGENNGRYAALVQ